MKRIFFLLFLILLINFTSATCQINNEFLIGENISVCTERCIFYNISTSNYDDCDNSVRCELTLYYPNKTRILLAQNMSRNNTIFEYNIGIDKLTTSGYYPGVIICKSNKGWQNINLDLIINNLPTTAGGISGGSGSSVFSRAKQLYEIELNYNDLFFNFNNIIYINTLDRNGDYYGVYNVSANFLTNIDNHTYKIIKINSGRYKLILNVPEQNIDDIYIKFIAEEGGKKIEKLESFTIKKATINEKIKILLLNCSSNLTDNLLYILIPLILIIILVIIIIIIVKKRK